MTRARSLLLLLSAALLLPPAGAASKPPTPLAKKAKKAKKAKRRTFQVDPRVLLQTLLSYNSLQDDEPVMSLPRARAVLVGRWGRLLRAKIAVDFGDFDVSLKSAYVDVRALKRYLRVRLGRFKRPFSRFWLTSSADQGLPLRTFLKSQLNLERDIGLMLHNGVKSSRGFRWAVGLFGDLDSSDVDEEGIPPFKPTLGVRVAWGMPGLDGYEETDRTGGPLRAGVGAGTVVFLAQHKPRRTGLRWGVDAIAKLYGVTIAAEVLGTTDADYRGLERLGAYAHAAYRPLRWLEVAARWSGLFPKDFDSSHEVGGGINTYFFGDHLRASVDMAFLRSPIPGAGALETDGWRIRTLVQVR